MRALLISNLDSRKAFTAKAVVSTAPGARRRFPLLARRSVHRQLLSSISARLLKPVMTKSLTLALALAATVVAQGAAAQNRDPLAVQAGRTEKLVKRGSVAYYDKRWDLSDMPVYVPRESVSGVLRLWGSNYFRDSSLGETWQDEFKKFHPGVTFANRLDTALIALPGLSLGLTDIGPSRKITSDELLLFQRLKDYHPTEVSVVTGSLNVPGWSYALAIYVHKDNPLDRITIDQLDGIYGAERTGAFQGVEWNADVARGPEGNIRTWKQLGVAGVCAEQPINVYGYNLSYHIPFTFADRVMYGAAKWNERLKEFTNYKNRDGSTELQGKQIADALGADPCGIGFGGLNFLTPAIKPVAVVPRGLTDPVPLDLETLRSRAYPLFDEVYFYLDRKPGAPLDPKVKEFVRYVLSRDGQDAVQRDAKYLPLPAAVAAEMLKRLE